MKRLFGLALVLTVLASGCSRTPKAVVASGDPVSAAPSSSEKTTSAPMPGVGIAFTPEMRKLVPSEEVPLLEQIDREDTKVVSAALPSIVRISASHPVDPQMRLFGGDMFQLPFGPKQHRAQPPVDNTAFGSGVVISRDGYILTNNHVVQDASSLEVQLNDKRTFRARLVAADDLVDVAILKIDATDLSPLPWGDSDKVQVGQQVFAIGNPFDLDYSVSKGIVSAKERNLPDSTSYQDYIQTDAAINPGNSGGALIDIHGQLIGINAAIASTSRVSMGIGFAIPSNLVRYAVEGLFKQGYPVRGFLGVGLPDSVDEGLVASLGLKSSQGALLAKVEAKSPADKAKLRVWDFITSVDGHKIDSEADLRLVVAQLPIGKQVKIDFIRDGKPEVTTVQIAESPRAREVAVNEAPQDADSYPALEKAPSSATGNVLDGVQVVDLDDKTRQKFKVDERTTSGVVVSNVLEGSPADQKGIERGDVIESAAVAHGSTQALSSAKDFGSLSSQLKPDQGVALLVHSPRGSNFVYLAPGAG